jgi:hypothetical protein
MTTPEQSSSIPTIGDTPEYRAYCAAQQAQDPEYTTLPDLARPELEQAKQEGPQAYAAYLGKLAGTGTFAVTGTIYVPEMRKVADNWMLLPNERHPDIVRKEKVDTQKDFPYVSGKFAYTLRSVHLLEGKGVMVVAEEFTERDKAQPRVMYLNQLDRFDLYYIEQPDNLPQSEL